ncbi:SAVED domain-containing protein [Polyangium mundeleinium]|uniref:SAVED domain-containing protein n=1 Tax=Polyangium mundeleinium TaxID=2995306 RepID=A0ABT5ESL1_9BACT|nr:SAVED domain-containing protein [Polyangium mundeleinium]MDC0744815.1 SAVED domain-containing protein [Polyangium mundeleinium]
MNKVATSLPSAPIKVLFLAANPDDAVPIRPDRELERIKDALRLTDLAGAIHIVARGAVGPRRLQDAILEEDPDIVHFSGHGTTGGDLLLEAEDGGARRVDKIALANLFALHSKRDKRVVVLNACYSGAIAEAVSQHVTCALGTTRPITDEAATEFAMAFYKAICCGQSVREAFERGKNALELAGLDPSQAARIYTRDGVDAASVTFGATPSPVDDSASVLLLLDLASNVTLAQQEILSHIQPVEPHVLCATQFGARPGHAGRVDDYPGCASAITRMLAEARALASEGQPLRYYVAGLGALPLFTHLGMETSSRETDFTLLNRRKDGPWDVLSLRGKTEAPAASPFFEIVRGLDRRSRSTERIPVYISTNYEMSEAAVDEFMRERGAHPGDIVEVWTGRSKNLDASNVAQVMAELRVVFEKLHDCYPNRNGLALFFAGPAPLAFMIGRAINEKIVGDIWVPNYFNQRYEHALVLPYRPRVARVLQHTADDELARRKILQELRRAVGFLQSKLEQKHLPSALRDSEGARFLERLRAIELADEPTGDTNSIDVSERTMTLGHGFLEALRKVDEPVARARIGQTLLLRKLYQFVQHLPSTTDEGRAGFALEEVDFWADAIAVQALACMEILRRGEEGQEHARDIVTANIEALLAGIETFDRAEHDERRILELPERKLRRYLIWHLQCARAATLQRVEDLERIFDSRLVVELAPLKGHLDARWDKVVDGPIHDTELFVVLGGRLLRIPSQGGFNPASVIEAIRTFDRDPVRKAMKFVREQHRTVLTPWVR